ncbi:MAG: hypothetical protein LBF54_04215 [Holosporaceae bacterium]|jgi:hypothetical protein|nr:hypothetical protein [Holosporaceae bacterium]
MKKLLSGLFFVIFADVSSMDRLANVTIGLPVVAGMPDAPLTLEQEEKIKYFENLARACRQERDLI